MVSQTLNFFALFVHDMHQYASVKFSEIPGLKHTFVYKVKVGPKRPLTDRLQNVFERDNSLLVHLYGIRVCDLQS